MKVAHGKPRLSPVKRFMLFLLVAVFLPCGAYASDLAFDDYFRIIDAYNIDNSIPRYADYLSLHSFERPDLSIVVDADSYVNYIEDGVHATAVTFDDFAGMPGIAVLSDENSIIEYSVNVKQAGLYDLSVLYYPVPGKSSAIQRSIFINYDLPFKEFALVEFNRVWRSEAGDSYTDSNGVTRLTWERDNQGNDLKPLVVEDPMWVDSYCYDHSGYVLEELSVYLDAGENIVSLIALREPM
ncbi:MAG: ABC transporter substrate-binding protein, partial [Oscillospiraceae bacterium]|nr:ABC transporter substrate-binding protein [Oscillospiraceae bacterium]